MITSKHLTLAIIALAGVSPHDDPWLSAWLLPDLWRLHVFRCGHSQSCIQHATVLLLCRLCVWW